MGRPGNEASYSCFVYTGIFCKACVLYVDVHTLSIFAKSVSFWTVSVDISGPADTNNMETGGESLLCTTELYTWSINTVSTS